MYTMYVYEREIDQIRVGLFIMYTMYVYEREKDQIRVGLFIMYTMYVYEREKDQIRVGLLRRVCFLCFFKRSTFVGSAWSFGFSFPPQRSKVKKSEWNT